MAKNRETNHALETKEIKQKAETLREVPRALIEKLEEDLEADKPILDIELIPDWY